MRGVRHLPREGATKHDIPGRLGLEYEEYGRTKGIFLACLEGRRRVKVGFRRLSRETEGEG